VIVLHQINEWSCLALSLNGYICLGFCFLFVTKNEIVKTPFLCVYSVGDDFHVIIVVKEIQCYTQLSLYFLNSSRLVLQDGYSFKVKHPYEILVTIH
jgi:hypothetical protein